MKTIAALMIAAALAPAPALAGDVWSDENMYRPPRHLDYDPPPPPQTYPMVTESEPSGTSGGVYVESGNIGNWYGRNGSHCVTTNMGGIVNVSCF